MIYGENDTVIFSNNANEEIFELLNFSRFDVVDMFDSYLSDPSKKVVFYRNNFAFVPKLKFPNPAYDDMAQPLPKAYLDVYRSDDWENGSAKIKTKVHIEFECELVSLSSNNGAYESVPHIWGINYRKSYVFFPDFDNLYLSLREKMLITPENPFEITKDIENLYNINFKN